MKRYILILPLFISLIHTSFAQNKNAEQEVDSVLEQLMQAYNAYDGAAIKSLMHDDSFARVIQIGTIYTPDYYYSITPEMASKQKFTRVNRWENKSVRVLDDQSAVALCEIISTTTLEGQEPFKSKTVNTIVMEKTNGKWSIITMHISEVTENRNF